MNESLKVPIDARLVLAWSLLPGLTLRHFWQALRQFSSIEELLASRPEDLAPHFGSEALARSVLQPTGAVAQADRLLEAARVCGAGVLTAFDGRFPAALREIPDPPLLLYARGRLDRLALPAVALVGARRATRYGRDAAAQIARDLSAAGVAVVSGLARGIDAAAHAEAVAGPGGTIAVLGCGVDVDYPPENRELRRRLESEGLVLTEYPPGTQPLPVHFPVRNRLIAGLACATVVVEAAERSGSLITARLAADFGRDVFAVPGSIFQETSAGTHALLRDGAILCRGAEDILAELFPAITPARRSLPEEPAGLAEEAIALLARLRREEDGLFPDELAESARLVAGQVLAVLFELELRGLVRALPGGRYAAVR